LDLRQLRYFLAIAEAGGITAAADALHMAQPPLSQQLKQLEEELQVILVERGSRHSRLTDAGEILRNRAEQMLDLAQSIKKEILDYNAGLSGTLALGAVSSSGLPDADVNAFHERYPGVSFELHEGNTYQVIDLLKKGVIEVGIVRTPFDSVDLECRFAESEPMMAIFVGDDPFEGKDPLSIADLRGLPLVIYRRFERFIFEECEEAGFEPRIACRNDDARTTLNWVRAGYGVGLVPRSALAREGAAFGQCHVESERLRTKLTAVVVKDRYLSTVARRFFECFRA
jgi:DNA-binding transcriptional LysR family regulator